MSDIIRFDKGEGLYKRYLSLLNNNPDRARQYLIESVNLGDAAAIHTLAYEVYNDSNEEISYAISLYTKAAEMGFEPSAWNLAKHYEREYNSDLYFKWLKISYGLGEKDAKNEIDNPFPFILEMAEILEAKLFYTDAIRLYRFVSKYRDNSLQSKIDILIKKTTRDLGT